MDSGSPRLLGSAPSAEAPARPAWPWTLRPTSRGVRLWTGLVLFAYVLSHYANHALGNVSLEAMEWGLDRVAGLWTWPPLLWLLYGSLLVHLLLGLWALYSRRPFRYGAGEALQLALGLSLPLLLVDHVVGTRIAQSAFATTKGYPQLLYAFFVESPAAGARQAIALFATWLHGCVGLYYWLRLQASFPRLKPLYLAAALLVPLLAFLGTVQGGRRVAELAADPAWQSDNLGIDTMGSGEEQAALRRIGDGIDLAYLIAILLVLAARGGRRGLEHRRGLVSLFYPSGKVARVPRGTSVLEASRLNLIPHASVCGGRGRCSTCRVRIAGEGVARMAPPDPAEQAVLDRVAAGPNVRLACQLRPTYDLRVAPLLPPHMRAGEIGSRPGSAFGEERFVVAMFVDMRGSTRLAETALPFDTVFLINRFLETVAGAVRSAGGSPNQFLGDGMLALFGLGSEPEAAAAAALVAVAAIGRDVEALNDELAQDLPEPIRFGIGLHAGTAILGEIGSREAGHSVFTAIGDPVNVAARLQGMTKALGVEAVVSGAVYETAGRRPATAAQSVPIQGRAESVEAHALQRATEAAEGEATIS